MDPPRKSKKCLTKFLRLVNLISMLNLLKWSGKPKFIYLTRILDHNRFIQKIENTI